MPATRLSPEERVRQALGDLPDASSYEYVRERLVVIHKVERGLAQAREEIHLMTQDEVEAHFARRRESRG
ncbi:MAG: hypothetical protein AAF624_06735 [Bacteroidota bacterium]